MKRLNLRRTVVNVTDPDRTDAELGRIIRHARRYLVNTAGAIAIAFALMAPVVVGAAGMALDFSRAYLVQQRLSQALDAAALAAAASSTDPTAIAQKVRDFFDVNFPPEELGITFEPEVVVIGNEIKVTGRARYTTLFTNVIGIDTIDVTASTTVQRQVQGIEVAMVLDVTGSMSTNNNIATLRTAATNFVNILFDRTPSPEFIKIGIVPYSTSVNVGPYGLGKDTSGRPYDDAFVNNRHDLNYTTSTSSSQWMGCILEGDYPTDTEDHEGPWEMYRYCRRLSDDRPICELNSNGTARRNPNYICPRTPIVPLTNNQNFLLSSISALRADGNTYGNVGMVWGMRVISPEFPFQEAVPWNNYAWRKAVVMMTDGVNQMHPYYSVYGPTADNNINNAELNERFEDVCENLRDLGVTVYTVTFSGGVNERTKEYYRDCATSRDQYFDAPSQQDLIDVFERISRELSNLHIRE